MSCQLILQAKTKIMLQVPIIGSISLEGLSLFEKHDKLLMLSLQGKHLSNNIVQLTRCSPSTVRSWLEGNQVPSAIYQNLIASYLSTPLDELFPKDGFDGVGTLVGMYRELVNLRKLPGAFVETLINATFSSRTTVKRWLRNRYVPKAWQRVAISNELGESLEILFL